MSNPVVCAECGGTWSNKYKRIFHAFPCSQNPLWAKKRRLPPPPPPADPDMPEACPMHPTEPKYECRACEVWSERDWEERHLEVADEP